MLKLCITIFVAIICISCNDSNLSPEFDQPLPPGRAGRSAASTRAMEEYPNTVGTTWTYFESRSPYIGLADVRIKALTAAPPSYRLRAILEVDTGRGAYASSIDYAGDTVFIRYMNVVLILPMNIGNLWGYYHNGVFDRAVVEDTETVETVAGKFAGAFHLHYNVLTAPEELWYVPRVGVVLYQALKKTYHLYAYRIKSPVLR